MDIHHRLPDAALHPKDLLRRHLKDGILEIDNTPSERSIRPLAIEKKNMLFTRSINAGQAAAAIPRRSGVPA